MRSVLIGVALTLLAAALGTRPASTVAGVEPDLGYVALGDSITAARYGENGGYVALYRDFVASDLEASVELTNLGVGGFDSGDLLAAVRADQDVRAAITSAGVLTVFIGLNDFIHPAFQYAAGTCGGIDNQDCLRSAVATFGENVPATLDEIGALNQNPDLVLRLSDLYYPTTGDPTSSPQYPVLLSYLQQTNELIRAEGESRGVGVASVFDAYNGVDGTEDPFAKGYLLADGVHPSTAGFEQIAMALRNTGYAPLVQPVPIGDADCDGTASARDATLILQLAAGLIGAVDCGEAADANRDGSITAVDAMIVLQVSAGLIAA